MPHGGRPIIPVVDALVGAWGGRSFPNIRCCGGFVLLLDSVVGGEGSLMCRVGCSSCRPLTGVRFRPPPPTGVPGFGRLKGVHAKAMAACGSMTAAPEGVAYFLEGVICSPFFLLSGEVCR